MRKNPLNEKPVEFRPLDPKNKPRRRDRKVPKKWLMAGAMGLAGIFVVTGLLALAPFEANELDQHSGESIAAQAQQTLPGFAGPLTAPEQAVADAHGRIDAASRTATGALDGVVAEAEAEAARLTGTGLPATPVGWVPGMPVAPLAPPVHVDPYSLPTFPAPVVSGPGQVASWTSLPTNLDPRSTPVPLDSLDDVNGLDGFALPGGIEDPTGLSGGLTDGLGGGLPTELGGLEELTGGLGPSPLGTLPVGGFDGNEVDPDEDGAQVALEHADIFLESMDGVYGHVEGQFTAMTGTNNQLVGRATALIEETRDIQADAENDLTSEAHARAQAIQADAHRARAELEGRAQAHVAHAEELSAEAHARIDATVETETRNIEAALADAQARLDDEKARIEAEAESRLDLVEAKTQEALDELARIQAKTGKDMSAYAEEVLRLSTEAQTSIRAEAEGHLSDVASAKAEAEAEARGAIHSLESAAADAKARFDGLAGQAEEEAQDAKTFGLAMIEHTTSERLRLDQEASIEALADLQTAAQAHVETIISEAIHVTQVTETVATQTQGVIGTIENEATSEVGIDLDYIWNVAEDYKTVPIPQHQERFEYWSSVHDAVEGDLTGLFLEGRSLDAQAQQVVQSALGARAQLEGLTP